MPKNQLVSQSQRNSTNSKPQLEIDRPKKTDLPSIICMKCLKPVSPPMLSHITCKSVFCYSHWSQFLQGASASFQCPKCGAKLTDPKEVKQVEVIRQGNTPCGLLLNMSQFEEHRKSCEKCKEFKQRTAETQLKQQKIEMQAESNPETYQCPFCPEPSMRRHTLLEHMRQHANMTGACPVCNAPSGGGKNYQSKNLYGHLMLRHKTDTPQIPATILKEQSPQPVLEPQQKTEAKKDHSKKHQATSKPGKLSQDNLAKLASKRSGFSLKSNLSERHLLASKPIQIHLESSDDDDDQTYTQQGLVGVFTFEANANGDHLQMVDYYWAKEHYDGSKIDGDSLKETEAEIKSCHDDQHPPDYLRNITNIIYPGGMPSPVKTSINEMHVHVNSFYKVVFYATKKFTGELNYLSILSCAKPTIQGDNEVQLTPFVFVLVTRAPDFALTASLIDLLYATSVLGHYESFSQRKQRVLRPEFHISLLFDWVNVMTSSQQVKRISMKDGTARDLVQVQNRTLSSQGFVSPNFSLVPLMDAIPASPLVTLYSCLLLEKKVILIGGDNDYQTQLALVIEGLMMLFEPLDSQVFTNITFVVSADMVMYMDKPGSLIMGMSDSMWQQHGQAYWTNFSFDTYVVIYHIGRQEILKKNDQGEVQCFTDVTMCEELSLPHPFGDLLIGTLAKLNSDTQTSMVIKQAFFNTLLLLVRTAIIMTDEQAEIFPDQRIAEFLNEFRTTTSYIDLQRRIELKDPATFHFAQCLSQLDDRLQGFQELISQQSIKMRSVMVSQQTDDEEQLASLIRLYANHKPSSFTCPPDTFFKLNRTLIFKGLRKSMLKEKKSHIQKTVKKQQIMKSQSLAQLARLERVKSIEKPGSKKGLAVVSPRSSEGSHTPKVNDSNIKLPSATDQPVDSTQAATKSEIDLQAQYTPKEADTSVMHPEASPSESSIMLDERKQSGILSFFTNFFLSKNHSAIDEIEDAKLESRRHCKSQRVGPESAFMKLVANQFFKKDCQLLQSLGTIEALTDSSFLVDSKRKESMAENVQQEEVQGRSKTHSMQITLNSLLTSKKSSVAHERESMDPEYRLAPIEKKPLIELIKVNKQKDNEASISHQLDEPLQVDTRQERLSLQTLLSPRPQDKSPAIEQSSRKYHSMTFCDDPRQCQQCQLLALVGRVALGSPGKPLSAIQESKEPSPYIRVARQIISPRQQVTPKKNTSQNLPARKAFQQESSPKDTSDNRATRKMQAAPAITKDKRMVMNQIISGRDLDFLGPQPVKSDSPQMEPGKVKSEYASTSHHLEQEFRSLFAKDRAPKPSYEEADFTIQVDQYLSNRLPTLQEEESKCSATIVQESSPYQSPMHLQMSQNTKQTMKTERTPASRQNNKHISKTSKHQIQGAPDSIRKQPVPVSSIKKAHIYLEGGLDPTKVVRQESSNQTPVLNNTSSFLSLSSTNQNSFLVAKESVVSPIHLRKEVGTVRHSALSPKASLFSTNPATERKLLNDTDIKAGSEVECLTPLGTGQRGKISMHKVLKKNSSTFASKHQTSNLGSNEPKPKHQAVHFASPAKEPTASRRVTQKPSGKTAQLMQLSELIGERKVTDSKTPTIKRLQNISQNTDKGWFSGQAVDENLGQDLKEKLVLSSDSDIADTSEDSPCRPEFKHEEIKETKQAGGKDKMQSLFMRPKAISLKSDHLSSTLRNSLPHSSLPHSSQTHGQARVVQASVKVNFGAGPEVLNMTQKAKSKSSLLSQTEAIQQIARRKENELQNGPPKN